MMEKRGAIELSIGTIVIIVLAMSMLILGLVLVKNIFTGASENILELNDNVKDKINKLIGDSDRRTVVYLSNQISRIKQNEQWGVAYGIKNVQRGTSEAGKFDYSVKLADPNAQQKCGTSEAEINSWIQTGAAGTTTLNPGETYYGIVRFLIPENSPLCIARFNIEITLDGKHYATDFFDVEVLG
jgi:hypothetical protein